MTPRTRAWWHAVADHADDPTAPADPLPTDVRDPWADRPLEISALTTAQQAVLAGLDDQPHGPRLDGIAADLDDLADDQPAVPRLRPAGNGAHRAGPGVGPGEGTGSAPGDPGPVGPQTRTRWTEEEQQER